MAQPSAGPDLIAFLRALPDGRKRRGVRYPQWWRVLISSNRSVGEWGEVFGDQVVAAAILDRLLHHSHVLTIRGDSYRLREKRRSGLIRPQAGGASQGLLKVCHGRPG